jgi:hypothetical protein
VTRLSPATSDLLLSPQVPVVMLVRVEMEINPEENIVAVITTSSSLVSPKHNLVPVQSNTGEPVSTQVLSSR